MRATPAGLPFLWCATLLWPADLFTLRNAVAAQQLVGDLLDLARITGSKMRLDVTAIDLRDSLCGALEAVRPLVESQLAAES